MIEKKKIKVLHEIKTKIVCDRCGYSASFECNEKDGFFDAQEFISIRKTGGYSSKFPGDGVSLSVDLCQNCFEEMLNKFDVDYKIEDTIS